MKRNYVLIGFRLENKLSQSEMAKTLGISQSLLSCLENGTREPSFQLGKQIADAIDVDLAVVFPKYRI